MSLQDDLLDPLAALYPRNGLNQQKAVIYHKKLRGLKPDLLDATFDLIVETHERETYPTIATILKAYKKVYSGSDHVKSGVPRTEREEELEFWDAADKVSKHPLAKQALENFVFRSMVCAYMNGKRTFSKADIDEAVRAQKEIRDGMAVMSKDHPVTIRLQKMWIGMQERNQELVNKYLKPMEA